MFFSFYQYAQAPDFEDVNLQKYWYYRWRLKNDFLRVGHLPGQSLPIQSRQGYPGIPDIEVADATIYLGFYLGVLATEYKLLCSGQNTYELFITETELYYALKALERLDKYGEAYLGMEPKVNGYFQRDDIPCDFLNPWTNDENYEHFNQQKHLPENFEPVFKVFTSDDCPNGKALTAKSIPKNTPSMSQDQVIWLLMGLMLVEKCVAPGKHNVYINGEHQIFDFNHEAKRHATNMINYLKYKYPNEPNKENWRIYRPDGQKVFPGQNVFMFKYPLSIIGERMHNPKAENNQAFIKKPGKFQWKLTRIWIPYKNVNGQMITVLGALSGKWGKNEAKTMRAIQKTWKRRNWENFYLPLMAVLHDIDLSKHPVMGTVSNDLTSAPAVGPYNLTRDEIGRFADSLGIPQYPAGWTRHLKYSSSLKNQTDGSLDNYMRRGFYSGLDYMLLFNLYYLTANKELPQYQNLINREYFPTNDSLKRRAKVENETQTIVGAFNVILVSQIGRDSLCCPVRSGYGTINFEPYNYIYEEKPFNPWDPENMKNNNYGWPERFNRYNHLDRIKMNEEEKKE